MEISENEEHTIILFVNDVATEMPISELLNINVLPEGS